MNPLKRQATVGTNRASRRRMQKESPGVVVTCSQEFARRIGRYIQPVVGSSSKDTVFVELRTQDGWLRVDISTSFLETFKTHEPGAYVKLK